MFGKRPSVALLAGPQEGVDYQALAVKMPEIPAELDDARKSMFDAAALVFMTLIDLSQTLKLMSAIC